jgi:hypothetical protein
MKSIIKLMTVALAAGLVVSCSDELNLEKKGYVAQEGDLIGTLSSSAAPTRVAMLDVLTSEGYTPVWNEGDLVNVFSASKLNYNMYELESGEGTPQGIFKPREGNEDLKSATDLYAITEAAYQYGVSAADTESGKIKLTAELPRAFKSEQLVSEYGDYYNFPSPYWGHASFGNDGLLNVLFHPLTGLLRLDMTMLPANTHAVVLVTGNNTQYTPTNAALPGSYCIKGIKEGDVFKSYQGSSEGLSGGFNTILDYATQTSQKTHGEGEGLGNDPILVCYDTLRVNFEEPLGETVKENNKVLFIPLIAQHYDNLKIIAVTEDHLDKYTWTGEIIRTFDDFDVANGEVKSLAMTSEITIATKSPAEASVAIARKYDGVHTLVVDLPNLEFVEGDSVLWIVSNKRDQMGNSSVVLNFGDNVKTTCNAMNIGERKGEWTGNVPNDGSQWYGWEDGDNGQIEDFTTLFGDFAEATDIITTMPTVAKEPKNMPDEAQRTVTLNFAKNNAAPINVTLPHANVVMTSEELQEEAVNIISANTENVSGRDNPGLAPYADKAFEIVSNERNAGLKFTGKYTVVNYYSGGAVYFLDVPELNTDQSEIEKALNIFGTSQVKSLRISDALINTITYPEINTGENGLGVTPYVITTGSAAIKQLLETGDKVKIQAYWTGKRLTPYSIDNGYEGTEVKDNGDEDTQANYSIDEGAIYTAAQLQGMGLSMDVYNYTISPKVESIWLGGMEYPWIGAEIKNHDEIDADDTDLKDGNALDGDKWAKIEDKFTLDGRNVTLKNMKLDINDPLIAIPGCCGTTEYIQVQENLGLIRCILTKDTCAIKNIQLDDVLLDTELPINNIGSLVGIIDAEKDVIIGGSPSESAICSFTNIRIASKGNQIGGMVGELESKGKVTIDGVEVESKEKWSYITGGHVIGHNNVGGLVGRITFDEAYTNPSKETTTGTATTVTTTTDIYHPVHQYVYEKDTRVATKDGVETILTGTYYYLDPTTMALMSVNATVMPVDGVSTYYSDEACTKSVGSVRKVTADDGEIVFLTEENKRVNLSSTTLYTYSVGNGKSASAIEEVLDDDSETTLIPETSSFTAATAPYTWGGASATVDTPTPGNYGYFTQEHVSTVKTTKNDGSDYPTMLTVANAKVNLDNGTWTAESGEGIVKAEIGNNAGGMIGQAVVDGSTVMQSKISVTVPTITATTTEEKTKMSQGETKVGNNAGGLIGNYQNKSTSTETASYFAGDVKSRITINADGRRAGGILGEQNTKNFTHNSTHDDPAQVLIGTAATKVDVALLKAENGWAGGLVGYQEKGKLAVASGADVEVKIGNIEAACCAGGAIGESNDDALIAPSTFKIKADITNMTISKDESFFPYNQTEYRKYCGTFGTLVGQKNHWLAIGKTEIKLADAIKDSEVETRLSDDKKDELLFGLNGSAATTLQLNTYKFWGDENGYLGWAKETSQYVVGSVQQGNYDFNVYKEY